MTNPRTFIRQNGPALRDAREGTGPGGAAFAAATPPETIPLRRVLSYGWGLLKLSPGLLALFLCLAIVQAAVPTAMYVSLQQLANRWGLPSATWLFVLWSLLQVANVGIDLANRLVQKMVDLGMANRLRDLLFGVVLCQHPAFFHSKDHEPGRLASIINQKTIETQNLLRQLLLDPVVQVVTFGITSAGMVVSFLDLQKQSADSQLLPLMIALAIALGVASFWVIQRIGGAITRASAESQAQFMNLQGFVNGACVSPEEIQAFDAEPVFIAKHRKALDLLREATIRQNIALSLANASSSLPGILVQIAVIGWLLFHGHSGPGFKVGIILSITGLVPRMVSPIQALCSYSIMKRDSWPAVETVMGLLQSDAPAPGACRTASNERAPSPDLRLGAKSLVFRYRPELPPVFNGTSFDFAPGKITGLVARMGQGKTTFFRLALRFYDPQQGQVLVGGVPTTELDEHTIRSQVTMMSQFPAFFSDTLRDNMRLANPEATDEQIQALCRRTGIWPILERTVESQEERAQFPNPLDRQFAGGKMLSGGQKKLLALTRCLLRSPTHLLLDEPTVGMDNEEKFELIPSLREACAGRTTVTVDHDVSWLLKFCDFFIVLDQGQVVQQGGKELAEQPGLFKHLLDLAQHPPGWAGAPGQMSSTVTAIGASG